MGQIIEVPGMGQIEFPDGMKDAEIVSAIKNLQMQPKEQTAPRADASTWQGKALATETNPVQLAVGAIPDSIRKPVDAVMNTVGTGFTKGITGLLGSADTLGTLGERGATWAGDKLGMPEFGRNLGAAFKSNVTFNGLAPSAEGMNKAIFGDMRVPESNARDVEALTLKPPILNGGSINLGGAIDTGLQAIPGMIGAGGGPLPAFMGGVTSELAGQATHGTPYEIPARILGGIPGYYAGAKATTPLPANLTPQKAETVRLAKEMGIPLSAAEETGRGAWLERVFNRVPGGIGNREKLQAKQGAASDAAALKTAGFEGSDTSIPTVNALGEKVGNQFEAAKNMPGVIDRTLALPKVQAAVEKYNNALDPADRASIVARTASKFEPASTAPTYSPLGPAAAVARPPTIDNLKVAIGNAGKSVDQAFDSLPTEKLRNWFNDPTHRMNLAPKELSELTNQQYQTFRREIQDGIDTLTKQGGNSTTGAQALISMRKALDNAAEASLGPDKLAAWQEARRHYFNFKIIESAMNRGTIGSRAEGTIGAGALTGALKSAQGDRFYTTTGGLNDVARVKEYLRDTFPNSGTPTIGAQIGAFLHPATAIPAIAGTLGASGAMTGQGFFKFMTPYLKNQTIPHQGMGLLPLSAAPGLMPPSMRLLEDGR